MEVRVYFEGHKALRQGFTRFLRRYSDRSGQAVVIRPIAGGPTPIKYFMNALRHKPSGIHLLLLDCEGPSSQCSLESLQQRSDWAPPSGTRVDQEQVFWMVQIMESWFVADKDVLAGFYGQDFNRASLPANPQVEDVPKDDVLKGLRAATRETAKGTYHKTKHAPRLLELIDAEKVQSAAPNCNRLFERLRKLDQ